MSLPKEVLNALKRPNGARFYKCDLQMQTPVDRAHWQGKKIGTEATELQRAAEDYIRRCYEAGLEAIGITDHNFASKDFIPLLQEAIKKLSDEFGYRIILFPGFEIEADVGKGVHLLALFDPDTSLDLIDDRVTQCGIPKPRFDGDNPNKSVLNLKQILGVVQSPRKGGGFSGIVIAPHSQTDAGIFDNDRIAEWLQAEEFTNGDLYCIEVPKSPRKMSKGWQTLLFGGPDCEPRWHREVPIACIMSSDAKALTEDEGAENYIGFRHTWIKMSTPSVESLRQAFLDSRSRIRLATDSSPEPHSELVTITWMGGFLDGASINLNENLNVLIGGRGTGKSTVIESVRYALGLMPQGDDAVRIHTEIVKHVLRDATKISLLVRSHTPAKKEYLIERTVPNEPVVVDSAGKVVPLTPLNVIPGIEVFGQHEISELTKSPVKLTGLLERFLPSDLRDATTIKMELKSELEKSRTSLATACRGLQQIEDELGSLPGLEETIKRYREAGLEDQLKEQTEIVGEEALWRVIADRIQGVDRTRQELAKLIPLDTKFLAPEKLEKLPGKVYLSPVAEKINELSESLETIAKSLGESIQRAEHGIQEQKKGWLERKDQVRKSYEATLRKLKGKAVDAAEFMSLRKRIEDLRPLYEKRKEFTDLILRLQQERKELVVQWEEQKAGEFRELQRAADQVNKKLGERVRVSVKFAGNRDRLAVLLREEVGGRLTETIETLKVRDSLSLSELANAGRKGKEALVEKFDLKEGQAERLAKSPPKLFMEMEELEFDHTTTIELNVAPERQSAIWRKLKDLSTGQKATAVLLLLLLESDAPLIIDQPEDDLDNRFIAEGVVPKMREEKRRRQFLFSTHNANIPVLGDAELIVSLSAAGDARSGKAEMPPSDSGSIDSKRVCALVGEILEGGKAAFEMRRRKYGF